MKFLIISLTGAFLNSMSRTIKLDTLLPHVFAQSNSTDNYVHIVVVTVNQEGHIVTCCGC